MNNERLTAFEDAILAIIMTILVYSSQEPKLS
ncbi:TMEM175 family protein [Mycobacterium kansasii]